MSRATVVRQVCSLKTPRHQILTGNFHEYAQRELTDGWTKMHNWCRRLHRSARGVSVFGRSGRGCVPSGGCPKSKVSVFVSKRVGFAPLTPVSKRFSTPGLFFALSFEPRKSRRRIPLSRNNLRSASNSIPCLASRTDTPQNGALRSSRPV
jgi:hypothetical protein